VQCTSLQSWPSSCRSTRPCPPSPPLCTRPLSGFPLTQKDLGNSFAVTSGHDLEQDWGAFNQIPTLVVLMAGQNLAQIGERLLRNGWAPDTPVSCQAGSSYCQAGGILLLSGGIPLLFTCPYDPLGDCCSCRMFCMGSPLVSPYWLFGAPAVKALNVLVGLTGLHWMYLESSRDVLAIYQSPPI